MFIYVTFDEEDGLQLGRVQSMMNALPNSNYTGYTSAVEKVRRTCVKRYISITGSKLSIIVVCSVPIFSS